ncbi:MAG: S46 family peptidase [Pseudomonadota bacterium]
MRTTLLTAASAATFLMSTSYAKEGMFTPEQLPEISSELRKTGLRLNPRDLADLTGFPMGAVISLGGCTASFVSPQGLVVTNHHCARGSIQYNSTEENNYLEDGFLADGLAGEVPAAPGSRVYVTVAFNDITDRVLDDLDPGLEGKARFDAIDAKEKAILAECEEDPGHRCQVASFYGGLEYKLIKRLEIRDVRLVYAPADAIGGYGGDIDNWQWPRHTGDFSFYRAYVAPDGSAADYAEENVPYQPEHHLKVSAAGLKDGDFVMAAGYPGSTSRYARLAEVEHNFEWFYPTYVDVVGDWVDTIEGASAPGTDARIKYESLIDGLNNVEKNFIGQIDGARRVGLVDRRRAREAALNAWLAKDASRNDLGEAIAAVDVLAEERAAAQKRNFWYGNAKRSALLSAAQRLYRLSIEKQKPDADRESGFQERDMTFFRQGLEVLERRYDPVVDKAVWKSFLDLYQSAPADQREPALDAALNFDGSGFEDRIDSFYSKTSLGDVETRLALMEASQADLEASDDPFIKLAVALYDTEIRIENEAKERSGRSAALRPQYMQAIIDWQKSQGAVTYPDANSTLRITYGNVLGGSPQDGMIYEPFTRLEGISAKDTGEAPFNSPKNQLDLIAEGDLGTYGDKAVGSVPVNFLTDLDSTGGNSGSATLNARGHLVGLLFDGTFESVNSDWDFDPRTTRTIHVDTRYMLWVMEKVDGADALIEEMDIVRSRR